MLLFPMIATTAFCSNQSTHLNYTIFIDGEFVEDRCQGAFIIKDSLESLSDSIPFQYEAGDLVLTTQEYQKLNNLKSDTKVKFLFISRHSRFCQDMTYTKEAIKFWFIQRYIILRIYNFKNKLNQKDFLERSGYGIEITIPGYGIILPRKRLRNATTRF